jgi:polyisoprenoid-binding protein YceI
MAPLSQSPPLEKEILMNTTLDPQTSSPLVAVPPLPAVRRYDIDSAHSSVTFKVRHLMVANVRGELGQLSGHVVIDEADITRSTVEVSIDASTINTRDEKRDEHLRSADFLDVKAFPTITFSSKRVQPAKGGGLFVVGDLTLHGVTREVTLDVEPLSPAVNDPWGNVKLGISARTRINRRDFGVVFNMPLEGGGLLVGEEIAVDLEVELGRKPAE